MRGFDIGFRFHKTPTLITSKVEVSAWQIHKPIYQRKPTSNTNSNDWEPFNSISGNLISIHQISMSKRVPSTAVQNRVRGKTAAAVGTLHEAPDQTMVWDRNLWLWKGKGYRNVKVTMCRERKTGRQRERQTTMRDPERESDVVSVCHVLLISCHTAVLYLILLI